MRVAFVWLIVGIACFGIPTVIVEALFHYVDFGVGAAATYLKVLSYICAFLITMNLALLFEWRSERREVVNQYEARTSNLLREEVGKAISDGIISDLIGSNSAPALADSLRSSFETTVKHLKDKPLELVYAVRPLLDADISKAFRRVDDCFSSTGGMVGIAEHLKVSRILCHRSHSYLQIQRRAYHVPDEWTADWIAFVDELAAMSIEREYIVLLEPEDIRANTAKIDSMRGFLSNRRFRFGVCNFRSVVDSTGGEAPAGVIEVFDGEVMKVADPPEGKYQGGINLGMYLTTAAHRPDILGFANLVKKIADYGSV